MSMFRLELRTDPHWVKNVVEGNLQEILTDHAYCEQKAAASAMALIIRYPERAELVEAMAELAQEEMEHFSRVHKMIQEKGLLFGRERKDDYVNELIKFIDKSKGREWQLLDRLLFAAMIEARSCERFKVLSEHIEDPKLADFYRELMESEARHYTTFIGLAKKYIAPETVDQRWREWLEFEDGVIANYGKSGRVHG